MQSTPYSSYVALQLFYRVLASSTNFLHLPLSCVRVFQFGTYSFCITFLTSSTQLSLWSSYWPSWRWVSSSILPLPFSYLASFRCDRAVSSVFVLAARMKFIIFLTFYYFIQLLISFYAPYTAFVVWAEYFP